MTTGARTCRFAFQETGEFDAPGWPPVFLGESFGGLDSLHATQCRTYVQFLIVEMLEETLAEHG